MMKGSDVHGQANQLHDITVNVHIRRFSRIKFLPMPGYPIIFYSRFTIDVQLSYIL